MFIVSIPGAREVRSGRVLSDLAIRSGGTGRPYASSSPRRRCGFRTTEPVAARAGADSRGPPTANRCGSTANEAIRLADRGRLCNPLRRPPTRLAGNCTSRGRAPRRGCQGHESRKGINRFQRRTRAWREDRVRHGTGTGAPRRHALGSRRVAAGGLRPSSCESRSGRAEAGGPGPTHVQARTLRCHGRAHGGAPDRAHAGACGKRRVNDPQAPWSPWGPIRGA